VFGVVALHVLRNEVGGQVLALDATLQVMKLRLVKGDAVTTSMALALVMGIRVLLLGASRVTTPFGVTL